ncbi:hypothetical protein SAMN05421636_1251 [Pricia antarctica]|uniref:Uncharacterized protein n=2 Tax=Pricia antarctica TaxID=641691 RepID=A0A1G7JEW2_9FLAO|nr:hypothetical protein SAMN05421636_1251 [Pricia antarctica]
MLFPRDVLRDIRNYSLYSMTRLYEHGNKSEKIASAKKFFGCIGGDNITTFKEGKKIFKMVPDGSPMVGLNIEIYLDYFENEKNDFEKACLLGFLAIKSILQNKPYCKIDNKFWLSRMDGKPKAVTSISELSRCIRDFSNHYQTRKIKKELRNGWYLITYSHYTRGFYVSFRLNLVQLVYEAEKRRKSTKQKQYKESEKKARLIALNKLHTEG